MYLGRLVVTLFSAVLLLYANSFVMKRRRRELGLYNILGLEKRHTARLMVWETLYCAAAAIVGGLAAGVLLSKLVLLLLLQLSHLPVEYGFEISLSGMADTAALFGFLFLLTLVWNLFGLLRSRPVELLHSASAGEREPRTRRLLVVLGAVTLGAGYATALTVEDPFTALAYFFLAVALVMVGTYCLFTAGSIALLKHLRNSPRYYYQPKHFTAVAGLLYRMKQNAVGLANICILSTMVLVTVSTTVSLYAGLEGALERMYPYDVDVVQSLDEVPPEQETALNEDTLERVQTAAADAGRKVELLRWSTPGTPSAITQETPSPLWRRRASAPRSGCSPPMTTAASPAIPWTWSRKRCWSRQRIWTCRIPSISKTSLFTSLGPSWTFPDTTAPS